MGYSYKNEKINDLTLAPQTKNVDLILGGHTHTFLKEPIIVKNASGKSIIINQVGWAGLVLGEIKFTFNTQLTHNFVCNFQNVDIDVTSIKC